ncbi:MAG: GGDEF domain-containing protein [Clostridiales bacterium]|nr:GGDEF domain-containing protein [Clostridiales bacterium]
MKDDIDGFCRLFGGFFGIAVVADASGNIIYSNRYSDDIFGMGLTGKNFDLHVAKYFEQDNPLTIEEESEPDNYVITAGDKWHKCLETPFESAGLGRLRLFIGIDITDLKVSTDSFMITASKDSMTGIYNRMTGIDCLNNYIRQVSSGKLTFSVAYFDINDLKYVNDNYGHIAGDNYILDVVSIVKDSIRNTDIFARMGGDEFLIIFPKCQYAVVLDIMETIMHKFDLLNQVRRKAYNSSISYGAMELNASTDLDMEYILNTVDSRMYANKQEYKRRKGGKP